MKRKVGLRMMSRNMSIVENKAKTTLQGWKQQPDQIPYDEVKSLKSAKRVSMTTVWGTADPSNRHSLESEKKEREAKNHILEIDFNRESARKALEGSMEELDVEIPQSVEKRVRQGLLNVPLLLRPNKS